jgi:hypothetical protein
MAAVMAEVPFPFTIPVIEVAPEPPFPTAKIPVTPEVNGKPVKFVAKPEAGVPSTGEVRVGAVNVLLVNVSIPVKLAFRFKAVCVAVLIGFNKSVVLSTAARPTIAFVMPETRR